ncbi:hypothetical protein GBAR_LOCUS9078 [Geodia barretti]|uniref:Uncharacterized protein n=1 Tax=Geodia barretti TaxID=519541 RepID=A0AA35WAW5_GEOBA|nr:hypothetical protein GBAR_LOCUS9078 [Geodia barretti]
MYSAVPPPRFVDWTSQTVTNEKKVEEQPEKPRHVHEHQWQKFCELRTRREKELSTGAARRIEATRNKTLRNGTLSAHEQYTMLIACILKLLLCCSK